MSKNHDIPHSIFELALFIDTGAFKAIYDSSDQNHKKAIDFKRELVKLKYPLYTTYLTIAESYRLLLYGTNLGTNTAMDFLDDIYNTPINTVVLKTDDEREARDLLHKYKDIKLTFTDAMNMIVMIRMGLNKVFSFDWHFSLPGFEVLPKNI